MKAKINDLFAWTHRAQQGDPRPSMDIFATEGVLLVSCWGDMASPSAGIELVLLDRVTGKIAWQDRRSVTKKTPETFAKEARKMLSDLPAAPAKGK